jgi:threonyl-tRNA synthetase
MIEEARKRDHRKIGTEMGLFAIDAEYVGLGMPLWLPKGAAMCEELEKLAKETEFQAGYVRVKTPHLAREKMYKTSGHLPYYADSMFPKIEMDEHREARAKIQARITELEKQLADYAKKKSSG